MLSVPGLTELNHVMKAAVRIDDASFGDIQVADDTGTTLQMVVWHGFPDDYAARYRTVRAGEGTPCGHALIERRRIVIRDLTTDPGFAPHAADALKIGYRALQSTPLKSSRNSIIGALTTHYAECHHPSPSSLRQIDRCARVAARLIENAELVKRASANGYAHRPLSVEGARAVEAVRILLPLLGESGSLTVADTVYKHLDLINRELVRFAKA